MTISSVADFHEGLKALEDISGYSYHNSQLGHAHAYLLPSVTHILAKHFRSCPANRRLFDLGCGNGSVAAYFADQGYEVVGVDPSSDGVAEANAAHPRLAIKQGSAYDNLVEVYGKFPALISLEVVEHVYAPRDYARTVFELLESGG